MRPVGAFAAAEETFDLLKIGTHTYRNVTVTTKAKSYIYILYEGGMTSVKTSELSPDILQMLGYNQSEKASAPSTNGATAWARAEVAKLEGQKLGVMGKQFVEKWQVGAKNGKPTWASVAAMIPTPMLLTILGALAVVYLFHCFCFMMICRKAGYDPGILVWLPVVQLIPLLRAAGMPAFWIIPFFLPVISIIPFIIWCFKIAQARGKSALTGWLLILPVTGPFAFLYLAFSSASASAAKQDEEREPEIMSLQTA
jgi:hypothetical protein